MKNNTDYFAKAIKHTKRYGEILTVLVRFGFGDLLTILNLPNIFDITKNIIPKIKGRAVTDYSREARVRMAIEELGTTFIKFGQILSSKRDMVPDSFIKELEKLQDEVPPFSSDEAMKIIESELKCKIDEKFLHFEKIAEASASIAQVHKAVLQTGETVAVKCQRPGIKETIKADIDIMLYLASLFERIVPESSSFEPIEIVKNFQKQILKEIDFTHEYLNATKFYKAFAKREYVHIPKVYKEYSTKKVITLEYIKGTKLAKIIKSEENGFDKKLIAKRGVNAILRQIFINGFFHADPHPGNIFILEKDVVCFVDFGMVGSIAPKQKEHLASLVLGISQKDPAKIMRALLNLTRQKENIDTEELERQIFEITDEYLELPLEDININEVLEKLILLISKFKLTLPANITFLLKSLMTLESLGRELDPEFQIINHLKRFSKELMMTQFNPKKIANKLYLTAMDYDAFLRDLPLDLKEILNLTKKGKLNLEFHHKGLEDLGDKLDRISYRLIFGIVLSALLLSSSVIVLSKVAPLWNGIPVIGLGGFVISGIMSLSLLISIFFTTRKK